MNKYIDAEEITPIMAEYVADVFSRKEHLDDISYGYCMEIADTFRRYAERAKQEQPKKSQKSCNDCPHCVDRKDQFGWHFKGCFGGPYNGKFIAEIDKCPLEMEQEEKKLPEGLEEAAENYIAPIENDEGLDYINFNGRDIKDAFIAGAEWGAEHLKGWHSVEECLPEMDEEVIVLKDKQNTGLVYEIAFGHLVDTERCIDYNGWNVPDVKFWMPMPKIPEE